MRILYGVQGTGNGHLSRARVMAKALVEHNIQVDFLFPGRKPEDFFDMECFWGVSRTGGNDLCDPLRASQYHANGEAELFLIVA